MATAWIQQHGLEARMDVAAIAPASASVVLRLRNATTAPLCLYLVDSAPFRGFQSRIELYDDKGDLLEWQPDLRPHGYVVSERDFHTLAPGVEFRFTQTVSLAGLGRPARRLRWVYQNDVTSWPGGVVTLEGPSRALFGGGPIPGIWTGRLVSEAELPAR